MVREHIRTAKGWGSKLGCNIPRRHVGPFAIIRIGARKECFQRRGLRGREDTFCTSCTSAEHRCCSNEFRATTVSGVALWFGFDTSTHRHGVAVCRGFALFLTWTNVPNGRPVSRLHDLFQLVSKKETINESRDLNRFSVT